MFRTIIVACLLVLAVLLIIWVVFPLYKIQEIASPLPYFLNRTANTSVTTIDLWVPDKTTKESSIVKPDISARAGIMYDLTTNELLYAKNIDQKLPLASLTKIMTAIIALENRHDNDKYYVDKSALVGEDSMGLTQGETLTIKELLYGLFLVSGNDAAEVLAWNFGYGRKGFLDAMNSKARSLGLSNTHFTNPTGLEGDGVQYTTVYDLLVITRYALVHFPIITEVTSTFDIELPYSKFHKYFYLQNETNLLTSYPGVKGVKTGFTPEAGLCLVTYYERDHKLIGVVLGSNNRRDDIKSMLDYALRIQGLSVPKHS